MTTDDGTSSGTPEYGASRATAPEPSAAAPAGPVPAATDPTAPTAGDLVPAPAPAPGDTLESNRPAAVMSLVDHLSELRSRIAWSLLAVALGSVLGFLAGEPIISFLKSPLPTTQPLVFTNIGDPFAIRLRIALVVGLILAMPVILWHVWRFVAPGLTPSERRSILPWIPAALAFFALGVGIAYIVLPYAAVFLLSFQTPELQALLTAREYFDFVTTLFIAFGLLMEFPILLVGLSRVGIVTSQRLRRARRMIVLGIAVFSAVATPGGDLVSPTVLGLCLYILFEGTIIVIRRSGR